ncbi:sodium:solute symporter [Pelosinus sp. sgz500959]|uniref:sodium:solute symporter family protein n=1 Tax=Pelosinus sp. sgz500959 TaxID=3242472 RepID=UPI00367021A1
MSNSAIALTVIFSIVLVSSFFGFYSGSKQKMSLEQWTVGNRNFGVILMWLLMAGEIYTTFAFLGASGWAYSRGGPTLYIIGYMVLAYVVSFYILPQLWEVGRKYGMQTQSDFFEKRYGSKRLAAIVSLIGVIFIIPYLQLQLTGLGIIMEVASFGGISRTIAMLISFALVAGFVYTSGIRAVASISVIKDILMLFAAVFLGIGLPYMYFGGLGEMFTAVVQAKPEHLIMPGSTKVMGHSWYISTVLLTSLGFYMWPHIVGASFTAKSADTLRRNAVIMPIYTITMPLIFFVGFTAILVIPGLQNGDLALLTIVQKSYPAWMLGLIGAAGALTAMVPAAILILASATLFAKNFYRPMIKPDMSDDQVASLAKKMVIVITLISLYFAIFSSSTLVSLLLLGYAGITQFFPGMVFGLYWPRANMTGVLAGIVTGISIVAYLVLNKLDPVMGINAGFFALCVNTVITVIISLITVGQTNGFDDNSIKEGSVTTWPTMRSKQQ